MVTIRDIAKNSGVSIATVSRVLNAKEDVSDEVRARVLKVCKELDYQRNDQAANLPRKKKKARLGRWNNNCIGLLLAGVSESDFLNDEFQMHYFLGMQRTVQSESLHVMVASCREDAEKMRLPTMVKESRVDGVILRTGGHSEEWVKLLASNVPVVLLQDFWPELELPSVSSNNVGDTIRLMRYLFGLGHNQIGFLAVNDLPCKSGFFHQQRLQGYLDFFKDEGIAIEDGWVQIPERDWSQHSLEQVIGMALDNWMDMAPSTRPTAILCCTDIYALTLIQVAGDRGIKVPDDLSVTGFMDIQAAALANPPLTTMSVASEDIGSIAVETLCRRVENPLGAVETIYVNGTIIERQSCRKIDPKTELLSQ